AESLGFDSIWLSEHHFWFDGYCPADLVAAGAVLGHTKKLRVGTAVMLLPMHSVEKVAGDAATLSRLGDGRLLLGVALGYRDSEFDGFGLRRKDRGKTMDTMLPRLANECAAVDPAVPLYVGVATAVAAERAARCARGVRGGAHGRRPAGGAARAAARRLRDRRPGARLGDAAARAALHAPPVRRVVVPARARRNDGRVPRPARVGRRGEAEEPRDGHAAGVRCKAARVRGARLRPDRLSQPVRQPSAPRASPRDRIAREGEGVRVGAGPFDLTTFSGGALRAAAEQAAAASFDSVWVAERRSSGAGGALAAATMVAQWTPVRVGAVVEIGAYHPLHLAEDIAVADVATAGRLEVVLRPAHDDPDVIKERLHELSAAVAGAHIQWEGLRLRIPARLADNGFVPQRLAINAPPRQPAVPA